MQNYIQESALDILHDRVLQLRRSEVPLLIDSFFWNGGFDTLFFIMFALVFGVIIITFIRGIGEWNRNNHSPRLTVDAEVVTKRGDVSYHHHNQGEVGAHTTHSTTYYVTFQVESGDRMEFVVDGSEYGMLVEGDYGRLTFQGTGYIGFERL